MRSARVWVLVDFPRWLHIEHGESGEGRIGWMPCTHVVETNLFFPENLQNIPLFDKYTSYRGRNNILVGESEETPMKTG